MDRRDWQPTVHRVANNRTATKPTTQCLFLPLCLSCPFALTFSFCSVRPDYCSYQMSQVGWEYSSIDTVSEDDTIHGESK